MEVFVNWKNLRDFYLILSKIHYWPTGSCPTRDLDQRALIRALWFLGFLRFEFVRIDWVGGLGDSAMYSGSSDGEGHEATPAPAQRKIPPASSMPWARNLRRFIGSGVGLGSEALMGTHHSLSKILSENLVNFVRRVSFWINVVDICFQFPISVWMLRKCDENRGNDNLNCFLDNARVLKCAFVRL